VLVEAAQRPSEPSEVEPITLLVFAVIGMANGVSLWLFSGADRNNITSAAPTFEVLADLLGSAAVVHAAVVHAAVLIASTGFNRADAVVAVVAVGIAIAIVPR